MSDRRNLRKVSQDTSATDESFGVLVVVVLAVAVKAEEEDDAADDDDDECDAMIGLLKWHSSKDWIKPNFWEKSEIRILKGGWSSEVGSMIEFLARKTSTPMLLMIMLLDTESSSKEGPDASV